MQEILRAPLGSEGWKVWLALMLVFVNWGIEARKWQLLMHYLQPFSYYRAFKSVFSGVTLSINTPNRIGEYGGRILFVAPGKRIRAVSLSIAGSISQLIITLTFGCLSVCYLLLVEEGKYMHSIGLSSVWLKTFFILSSFVTCGVVLFYFRLSWLVGLIEKIPAAKRIVRHIHILEQFSGKLLLRLLLLSFFRYTIFIIQYILLLQAFAVSIPWMEGILLLSTLFLILAVVPSFAIADLGIRGKFSVALLGMVSTNVAGILGTTFGIWFANLFLPALLGSIFILGIKFLKEKH